MVSLYVKFLFIPIFNMSDEESIPDANVHDLEVILEGDEEPTEAIQEEAQENTAENSNDEGEEADKKKVKPKRVVKNPKPKLNEETLKGPRGLSALGGYFERVKFKGPGHEEQDLNVLMKTYEYWCHRLFPKYPFDSCIERLEKLGTKRATITQIKRIRMGLIDEEKVLNSDDEIQDSQVPTDGFVDTVDQFDQLLADQPEPEVTAEQLDQMKKNRERAEKLRQERLQRIKEKSSQLLESSQCSLLENAQDLSTNVLGSARTSVQENEEETEEVHFDQILNIINGSSEKNLQETESRSKDDSNEKDSEEMNRQTEVDFGIINKNEKSVSGIGHSSDFGNKKTRRILSDSEDDEIGIGENRSREENTNEETEEVGFDQILGIINESNEKSKDGLMESDNMTQSNKKKSSRILSDSDDEYNLVIDEDKESEVDLSQVLDTIKERQRIIKQNSGNTRGSKKHNKILSDSEDDE